MRNHMIALGITVLLFAPVSAWADGPNADASYPATAGNLFSLAAFQDEPPTEEAAEPKAEPEAEAEAESQLIDKSDQTGTNPIIDP